MNFDFLNTELEPNDFEGHKKLRDIIRKSAKEAGSPHVIVGTFNTEQTHSNAIAMTSILFEILMNSLINAYVCTEDAMALDLLQTVHNVLEIHAHLASAYSRNLMEQAMTTLSYEDRQKLIQKIRDSKGDVKIPDAILKAFDEMDDPDKQK